MKQYWWNLNLVDVEPEPLGWQEISLDKDFFAVRAEWEGRQIIGPPQEWGSWEWYVLWFRFLSWSYTSIISSEHSKLIML